jgi:hypothetical protein
MKKIRLSLHAIIIFIGMLFLYKNVNLFFGYWGFTYDLNFSRIFFSIISLLLIIKLSFKKNIYDFNRIFLFYWIFFVFLPITILFSVSLINYYHFFIHFSFIFFLSLFFSLKRQFIFTKNYIKPISFEKNKFLILCVILVLSTPLIEVLVNFNVASFNLFDVYGIRLEARESGNRIIGYLRELLSRVVYPFFLIYGYIYKKWILFMFGLLSIVLIFGSTGALKSIIVIVPISFLFIKLNSYYKVQDMLLILVYCLVFLPLIETYFFGSFFLTDLPSRRLFFVPGLFENAYFTEYIDKPQFYMNSILKFLNETQELTTKLIGSKYFGKPEMNANVGIVLDGFINIGYFGVILHAVIIYFSLGVLNGLKINPKFFGIFFIYFYYMNTSFIGTLFLTHGFLFLLIFFYIIKTNHKN